MKKFYFLFLVIVFCSLIVVSCSDNTYVLLKNNISEIREKLYTYRDEEIYVNLMTGQRESDYLANGVSTPKINFAKINLQFYDQNYKYNERKVDYTVEIDGVSYSGAMLNNPYDNSFVVDLGIKIDNDESIIINFTIDNSVKNVELTLTNADWKINAYTALEVVGNDLREYIQQFVENNSLKAEVFIKIVYQGNYNNWFWHIQIVSENGAKLSEIIDINNGEIISKNIQ